MFFHYFPIKTLILGYTSFLDSHLTRWEIIQASSVLEAEGEAGRKSHVGWLINDDYNVLLYMAYISTQYGHG